MADTPPAAPPAAPPPAAPPAAPPPAAPPAGFDWAKSGVSADDLGFVQNKGWADIPAVLNSYKGLEKLIGAPQDQIIRIPKADAPVEEWNGVWDKLGRPKTAAEYSLPVPEGDKGEFAKQAAEWFHEVGVPHAAAKKLAEKWNEYAGGQMKAIIDAEATRDAEQIAALTKEWGAGMQANSEVVDRAASTFGMTPEQLGALKKAMGPGEAMKFMHNIGSKIGVEDKLITGDTTQPGFGQGTSPAAARAEISRLQKSADFAREFNSQNDAIRSAAREKMRLLNLQAKWD